MEHICGIYKIENLINHKVYIGQSVNIKNRWKSHLNVSKNPVSDGYEYPLYRAFRKYGLENFSFKILEECPKEKLNQREEYYIKKYNSLDNNFGYNQRQVELVSRKLTPKQIEDIKEQLKNSTESTEKIASRHGISGRSVRAINNGQSWWDENTKYPIRQIFTHNQQKHYYCSRCGKRINTNSRYCQDCGHIVQRKTDRPNRDELKKLIRELPFTKIAEIYGVTDNAIRKWCDAEKLPRKKSQIKSYSDEEWVFI